MILMRANKAIARSHASRAGSFTWSIQRPARRSVTKPTSIRPREVSILFKSPHRSLIWKVFDVGFCSAPDIKSPAAGERHDVAGTPCRNGLFAEAPVGVAGD
jgi:hypothetical protein